MEFLLPLLLSLPPGAGPMIGVAMSLGIFMVGAMFMVAYAMQNPQLIALAREELAALIFTAIIIAFFIGSDSFLNGLVRGMLEASLSGQYTGFISQGQSMGGLTISHLNLALASLTIIENKLKSQYVDLYLFEALIGFLSTISFPLGSPIPAVNIISFSLAPFTGLNLLSNAHTVVVESIGYLVTVLWAKQFLLIFARDVVPILLFPLGLVLRAIPFFRRTGSSVIAICFAMYFVMPFAIILSNYMIFDIFKPADFTYNPDSASFFGTDQNAQYFNNKINEGRGGAATNHLLDQFNAPDVATEASNAPTDECAGNFLVRMICSVKNLVQSAIETVGGFFSTVWAMFRFMVGMTGDFFWTMFNNPLMPQSMSSGLFFFVIQEVALISPFIILVMLTTVIEIIITVTTYRNVSVLLGGEAELVGLSKVV
ncbi:MAG: hypothetical protein AB1324_08525 [Candidatus Micrarchaeota archaeon]